MRFKRRKKEGVHKRYTSNRRDLLVSLGRKEKRQKIKMIGIGQNENHDLLSILRNVIFFIAIYLYFMGWIHTYYFYYHFGISSISVNIPFYYFFIYSYNVIANIFGFILVVAAIVAFFIFTAVYPRKWLVILVLIILFPVFFYLAKEKAGEGAQGIRIGNAKTITLFFKKDTFKFYPKEFINANKKGKLKLVTQTTDKFYVIYQPPGEAGEMPYGFTYDIPRTDILLAKIEVQNISKREIKNVND